MGELVSPEDYERAAAALRAQFEGIDPGALPREGGDLVPCSAAVVVHGHRTDVILMLPRAAVDELFATGSTVQILIGDPRPEGGKVAFAHTRLVLDERLPSIVADRAGSR